MFNNQRNNSAQYADAETINPDGTKRGGSGGQITRIVVTVIIVLALLIVAWNSIYSLKENEYAVITTLGVASIEEEPGIHVKVPFIQELNKVQKNINSFTLGFNPETGEEKPSESFMITRDYNFVNIDFFVEYRVVDPVKYLYASENPEAILKNLTQSYIRDTIGLYDVDSVITTGKSEIQLNIKDKITDRLIREDIGLQLVNITIQDAEPPTEEVIDAFKNVENAKQGKETSINRANQKRNEDIPAARALADETLKTAQAQAEERINEAIGQTARLNELYAEYQKYPLVTKQRMFYETMEEILPGMKVIIEKSNGTTETLLPLDSFSSMWNPDNNTENESGEEDN